MVFKKAGEKSVTRRKEKKQKMIEQKAEIDLNAGHLVILDHEMNDWSWPKNFIHNISQYLYKY